MKHTLSQMKVDLQPVKLGLHPHCRDESVTQWSGMLWSIAFLLNLVRNLLFVLIGLRLSRPSRISLDLNICFFSILVVVSSFPLILRYQPMALFSPRFWPSTIRWSLSPSFARPVSHTIWPASSDFYLSASNSWTLNVPWNLTNKANGTAKVG